MTLDIRKAALMDLESIYQIERDCFAHEAFSKEMLEYFLGSPDFVTLIAVLDGKVVGFITGSIEGLKEEHAGHIYSVDVRRQYRRRGVGSTLLRALEHFFADGGVETCYLEVREDNVAAKKLYLKQGYKPLETLKDYYGFGVDGLRFKKDLKTSR